jgi:hypothetical protein
MSSPTWLTGTFAALMLTVAVYCAGRLFTAGRWQRPTELDTDLGHVLMGIAMAGMRVARLRILPPATWEAIFALGAAWFAWQLLQSRRHAPATPWRCLHPAPTWSSAPPCSTCSSSCHRSRAVAPSPAWPG